LIRSQPGSSCCKGGERLAGWWLAGCCKSNKRERDRAHGKVCGVWPGKNIQPRHARHSDGGGGRAQRPPPRCPATTTTPHSQSYHPTTTPPHSPPPLQLITAPGVPADGVAPPAATPPAATSRWAFNLGQAKTASGRTNSGNPGCGQLSNELRSQRSKLPVADEAAVSQVCCLAQAAQPAVLGSSQLSSAAASTDTWVCGVVRWE
jgi:hypothetical protein